MTWNTLLLVARRNPALPHRFIPSLESLEDRASPALLAVAPLWF